VRVLAVKLLAQPAKPAARMAESRISKLAKSLDALPAKDELRLRKEREIEELRRQGARALYSLCKDFVDVLNGMVTQIRIEFSPEDYEAADVRNPSTNLFQINANGRVVQITFGTNEDGPTTERFRIPYMLEGAVRWYNQDLLEQQDIQEHQIFYCVDKDGAMWRFYDVRRRRPGVVDREYLISLLEQLV
jgi:hypothetical protein